VLCFVDRYAVPENEEAKLFEIIRMLIERGADINARTDANGEVKFRFRFRSSHSNTQESKQHIKQQR
jgi:hypothetical protein